MDGHAPRLRDLPNTWARFCLGVGGFAANELGCDFSGARCLVACSGGADSTALLCIADLLCRRGGGSVIAAHLNHGLRPEAPGDGHFVAELCAQLGIPLHSEAQDVAALAKQLGIGVEEAGRRARYDFLERVRKENGAQLLLVAHQLNDLAEDQLLRLQRGAGWPALGGMTGYDPARFLLRPLLLTPKTALEEFLRISGRSWRVDSTNFDRATSRNRIRNDLLPGMLHENPAYLDAAARLWRQARLDETHWSAVVAAIWPEIIRKHATMLIPGAVLDASPAPLRLRIVKAVLDEFGAGQALCDGLFQLDALWLAHKRNASVRFPGDKEARIVKTGILVQVIDRKKECG